MKTKLIWVISFLAVEVTTFATSDDCRSFENLDVEKFKRNPYRMQAYLDCVLDYDECYEMDARIRARAVDFIASDCCDCSEKERRIFRDLVWIVAIQKPNYLHRLEIKYDKKGDLRNFLDTLTEVSSLVGVSKPNVSAKFFDDNLQLGLALCYSNKDE